MNQGDTRTEGNRPQDTQEAQGERFSEMVVPLCGLCALCGEKVRVDGCGRGVMRRSVVLVAGILLVVAGALAAGWVLYFRQAQPMGAPQASIRGLQVFGELPDFALTERDGRRRSRADLAGKVWVADFIYTRCTDTCPLQTAQMARLHQELAELADLLFVSISVDPTRDTPRVLRAYAERYGADPARWWFLTGKREPIYTLIREGFHLSVEGPDDAPANTRPVAPSKSTGVRWNLGPRAAWAHQDPDFLAPAFLHSSWFVLGDRRARIRGYYRSDAEAEIADLRRDIRLLLAEIRP
jgi:protein SCO1